ncbi:ABC transporter ATP-binding protein [Candidatus Aminicenantes bacterium AC-334-K16]|jgi:ABC-2 type transport system ATP-binding protein|nr:ABC transporter ATP-binding protein [Candidatus Aminicenantes bacterium AC-334-K16]
MRQSKTLELRNISYAYGRIKALSGISLAVDRGPIGLLGPNGAGKSTLLRLLLGFLSIQEGEAKVMGYDIARETKRVRQIVGYMPEDESYIPGVDGVTLTALLGELSGMPRQEAMKRAHDVLFYVGLGESRYRLVDTYSKGMRQRLKLAQALVHDPQLVLLDEPTSGLDPQGREEILELIKDIAAHGVQVLVSSHILPDIEETCKEVIILNRGQVAAQGNLQQLKQLNFNLYELRLKGEPTRFLNRLQAEGCQVEKMEEGYWKLYLPSELSARLVFKLAVEEKVQIRHFLKSQSRLEDLFAQVVGEEE